MLYFFFILFLVSGFIFGIIVFVWALKNGQFKDQQRARYLALDDDEDLANAEFIVLAVNSHDALVEALDEGMNVLADIAEEENYTEWDETIAKMSKALANAKGKS